jgi:REP element-mobilizing transposase RayT
MGEYGDIRTGRHCVFVLHAHLVFVTKYQHEVFTGDHLTRREAIMREVQYARTSKPNWPNSTARTTTSTCW